MEENIDLKLRIFNLVIGRLLKEVYLRCKEEDKKLMEETFSSGDLKEAERFIKKYIPDFQEIFAEESKKLKEEIGLLIA